MNGTALHGMLTLWTQMFHDRSDRAYFSCGSKTRHKIILMLLKRVNRVELSTTWDPFSSWKLWLTWFCPATVWERGHGYCSDYGLCYRPDNDHVSIHSRKSNLFQGQVQAMSSCTRRSSLSYAVQLEKRYVKTVSPPTWHGHWKFWLTASDMKEGVHRRPETKCDTFVHCMLSSVINKST